MMDLAEGNQAHLNEPLVSFLLVNYRSPEMTLNCLDSIDRHCRKIKHEILVVDNGSGDDSLERLAGAPTPIKLISSPANLGFGGGCKRAAREASGRYFYLLNTDTVLREDSAAILADFLDRNPDAVAAGSRLALPDGQTQPSAACLPSFWRIAAGRDIIGSLIYKHWPALGKQFVFFLPQDLLSRPRPVDWCVGASLMVRSSAYRQIGGFDENFFLYAEELDLCRRLATYGQVWFTPETTVTHLDGGSSQGRISARRLSYIAAGHRYYYRKHHGRLSANLYVAADFGGALVKSFIWRLLAWGAQGAARRDKAAWNWTYARNYFKISYPLKSK